jgi:amino acid transporter
MLRNSPYGFAAKNMTVTTANGTTTIEGSTGQFLSFWTSLTAVCWSLVGFETIGVTAAENRDLERWETMRLASKKLFMRITTLYTLATFAASLNVPMNDAQLRAINRDSRISGQHSIFVLAAVRNHLVGWPSFFNGFFIFSALTSAVNAVYVSSRLLHALASIPEVWPLWAQKFRKRLERTSSHGIPLGTVAVSWLFGLLAFLAVKSYPSTILSRITANATVSFFIVYGVVCASFIPFYHRIKVASEDNGLDNRYAYNREDEQYPYRTRGQLFRSWYGLIFCLLIVLFNGWRSFFSPFGVSDFIVSYIGIVAFFVIVALYHMRTDGLAPWKWRRHASLQIQRPPPKIVVAGRRRGTLHLPNKKKWFTTENFEAMMVWLWCWLR